MKAIRLKRKKEERTVEQQLNNLLHIKDECEDIPTSSRTINGTILPLAI